ncbi:MAG TPA: response regulator, partial [Pyrinomonadaceae bacterium]|nr:response regulator [Pyrinomonadaceae bacterium]
TILVVEDYEDSRQMLKFFLEDSGYRVAEAVNGYEAIEYVKKTMPDLILMDMSMPEIDGLAATRHIKKLADTDHIPVICITAHDQFYSDKAIEAGCSEVVGKPLDLESLSELIERYLKND